MPLAELGDLEAIMGQAPDNTTRANLLLEFASAVVAEQCRQTISAGETTTDLPGSWGNTLELGERPVTAVTEVVIVDPYTDAEVTVAPSAYGWRSDGTLMLLTAVALVNAPEPWDHSPAWGGPEVTVRVTYSHGFAEVPTIVRFVTAMYAARLYNGAPLASAGVQGETFDGSYSVQYGQGAVDLPDDLKRLLRRRDKRLHTAEV